MKIDTIINMKKKKLIEKANKKGIYENFGQKEVSDLKDAFFDYVYGTEEERTQYKKIEKFNDWCMDFNDNDLSETTR